MPLTGRSIGTPASMSESVEPQTEPIDDEPFDSSVSETMRIVYGNSSAFGITGSSARWASAPWPMSRRFGPRIFNAHMKDVWWGKGDGTVGTFGGHTSFGDARRAWDFRSVGRGDVRFEDIIVALNDIGYQGPLSIEWEDSGMDRDWGAPDALAFVRRSDFPPSSVAFDDAFQEGR